MIDLFICSYLRQLFTGQTIKYLKERTKTPYRLFLIDNGGNEEFKDQVDYYISLEPNMGIHAAWNTALALAESEYFITSDNDIYVPDLDPDWLAQLTKFMDERPDYGAISLHPHILIGAASFDPKDPEDVKEVNMAGAVMRIMRTDLIRKVGGWEHQISSGRNNEERVVSSRIQSAGFKTGRTTKIRTYHPWGNNWGYPEEFTPEMQKHNPELKDYVKQFDQPTAYDERTWLPK
jgi:glycosyltransferase involved in cell wall biosynthesis